MTTPAASPVPITCVIPTRNEAANIGDCVRALAWSAEVIVVDSASTDGTPKLALQAGARVLDHPGPGTAQRNAGIAAASQPWIFTLDADERVGPSLAAELATTVAAPAHEAYAVRRRNVFLGKRVTHGGWGHDWVVRLFRRDRRFVERQLHGALERVDDVGKLGQPLEHVPYRDLTHYMQKLDRFTRLGAEELAARGRRPRVTDLLVRPPVRFIRMYVLQLGILDGWHGMVLSGL